MRIRSLLMLGVLFGCGIVCTIEADEAAQTNTPAATSAWTKELAGQLTLAQARFDNWAQGGENSTAWQLGFNGRFALDEANYHWEHTGKIAYGETQVGAQEFRKSSDILKLQTVYTRKISKILNPYVSIKGETQLAPSYAYTEEGSELIAKFMDPGYFVESLGLGYGWKPILAFRLGFAVKETVTRDFAFPYADDPQTPGVESFKVECGLESVLDLNWKISQQALFTSKAELFSHLKSLDTIDVSWDNNLTLSFSKYLNLHLNIELLYDHDISPRRQIKQTLSLGITYSLFD
jgi:hypothetical protein